MTSGQDLIQFADENGINIIPYRINKETGEPDEWIEKLDSNNGLCPAKRECPCETCVVEIRNAKDDNEACCNGIFFCDERYIKFWMPIWTKAGVATKEQPIRKKQEAATPEIKETIKALDEIEEIVDNVDIGNEEETLSGLDRANNILKDNITKHNCIKCADYVEALGRKLTFLKDECKLNPMACSDEQRLTVAKIEMMKERFLEVDREVVKQDNIANGITTEELIEDTRPKSIEEIHAIEDPQSLDYHKCASIVHHTRLDDVPDRNMRLCIASKMCGKQKLTKEDALKACTK
jgi:hypothetical protein